MNALTDAFELCAAWGPALGPFVVATTFYVWRDWRREDRLIKRIETLENEYRDVLLPLVANTTAAIERNTIVMSNLERHLSLPSVRT